MLLFELFDDTAMQDNDQPQADTSGKMFQRLRQAALDLITPSLGQNVPFVTMQQVVQGMSRQDTGIVMTPGLVMQLLDPEQVKAVKKIEGDRIYLARPGMPDDDRETDEAQAAQDQQQVSNMANQQINQDEALPANANRAQQKAKQDQIGAKAAQQISKDFAK
jgi:hypothetical protein